MAEITINNQKIIAEEGQYILNTARANGIFIPAICYLSGCSPTLACKLCMVEADGKRVYACNAKVKDGMNITTNTPEINAERKAIMQSYCVNHPLECGVCDKSGECELQDFTLLFGVDNQNLFVAESNEKFGAWAQVKYDPSLCILCERCVTTCKDNLGEANLKVVKSESMPQLDSAKWKEIMPKDAFSVWNRKQKGKIGFVGENPCIDCAECVSVCPVGALGVKSFQYTTNAWELQKVDSSCNLCPSGCKITLEGKKDAKNQMRLYRVTNDFNFNPICAAGRFAQDIGGDFRKNDLDSAILALKGAESILVGGNTTNNEAKFLQNLKEHFGVKLINQSLKNYFEILDILGESKLATLDKIGAERVLISVAGNPKYENPLLRYKINNALKMQKDCAFIFANAMSDNLLSSLSKKFLEIIHTPFAESSVILAICGILDSAILEGLEKIEVDFETQVKEQIKEIVQDENGAEKEVAKEIVKSVVEKREYYKIFDESGIAFSKFLELQNVLKSTAPLLIIGTDFYSNKSAKALAKILKNLMAQGKIKVMLNPPSANANGIYANLSLDSADLGAESSIGWREKGKFTFDSVDADFILPYFSAINDSIINMDNRLLPIRAIFDAPKYLELLSAGLNMPCEFNTPKLANFYDNSGADKRGVLLEWNQINSNNARNSALSAQQTIEEIAVEVAEFLEDFECKTGLESAQCSKSPKSPQDAPKTKLQKDNAYLRDIAPHFYPYTKHSTEFIAKIGIYVSKDKMQDLALNYGVKAGETITLQVNSAELQGEIYTDNEMGGDFFAISPQIEGAKKAFGGIKFAQASLIRK